MLKTHRGTSLLGCFGLDDFYKQKSGGAGVFNSKKNNIVLKNKSKNI
jgi:hypothetical protein